MTELEDIYARSHPLIWDILRERVRQLDIWGEQNWPWAPLEPREGYKTSLEFWFGEIGMTADIAKDLVEIGAKDGTLTYADILMEEVIEALAETEPDRVVEELLQVAAVALAAAESIKRNGR